MQLPSSDPAAKEQCRQLQRRGPAVAARAAAFAAEHTRHVVGVRAWAAPYTVQAWVRTALAGAGAWASGAGTWPSGRTGAVVAAQSQSQSTVAAARTILAGPCWDRMRSRLGVPPVHVCLRMFIDIQIV